jgi:hypothetical protein
VTIVDPHHPLFGQCLPVVGRPAARGAAQIVVRLPDGRERSVGRPATDLAGVPDCSTSATAAARISVRSLLPLANRIRIMVICADESLGGEALPGRRSASTDCSGSGKSGRSDAAPVAPTAPRGSKSVGPAIGPASPTSAVGRRTAERDV